MSGPSPKHLVAAGTHEYVPTVRGGYVQKRFVPQPAGLTQEAYQEFARSYGQRYQEKFQNDYRGYYQYDREQKAKPGAYRYYKIAAPKYRPAHWEKAKMRKPRDGVSLYRSVKYPLERDKRWTGKAKNFVRDMEGRRKSRIATRRYERMQDDDFNNQMAIQDMKRRGMRSAYDNGRLRTNAALEARVAAKMDRIAAATDARENQAYGDMFARADRNREAYRRMYDQNPDVRGFGYDRFTYPDEDPDDLAFDTK